MTDESKNSTMFNDCDSCECDSCDSSDCEMDIYECFECNKKEEHGKLQDAYDSGWFQDDEANYCPDHAYNAIVALENTLQNEPVGDVEGDVKGHVKGDAKGDASDAISASDTFIEYFSGEDAGEGGDAGEVVKYDDIVWSENFGPSEIIQKVIDTLDPEKDKEPISELMRLLDTMGYAAPEIHALRFWGGDYTRKITFTDICKTYFKHNPHVRHIYNSASMHFNNIKGFSK